MSDDLMFAIGMAHSVKAGPTAAGKTARQSPDDPDKLQAACKGFESLFINQMMQQMRKTVPQDGLFNGGRAEKIYTEMLDSEMAQSISNRGGMGLAAMLYRQLATEALDKIEEEPK